MRAASVLGDRLLETARVHPDGALSWSATRGRYKQDLVGVAHGVTGIALALLELAAVTGASDYREVARAALLYEQNWFDARVRNWPRFNLAERGLPPREFALQWCHGAPGIGGARLRASILSGDTEDAEYADIAIKRTLAWCEGFIPDGTVNLCLCHGLAGNADLLLGAECRLPSGSSARDAVRQSVLKVAEQLRSPQSDLYEYVPGLMLGQAGVGYFLLRAAGAVRSRHRAVAIPCVTVLRAFRAWWPAPLTPGHTTR